MKAFLTNLRDGSEHPRFEPDFLESAAGSGTPLPDSATDTDGRVLVDELIAMLDADDSLRPFRPLVVVTGRDLARPGCGSLFGYADRERRICVVSTARLGQPVRPRLENVIRHELGHLQGFDHCRRRGCLMRPAQIPEDLDGRNAAPCPRCSRRSVGPGTFLRRAAAVLFLVSAFAGMNLAASLLKRAPRAPFALANGIGEQPPSPGRLSFNGSPLEHSGLLVVPGNATEELNRLYRLVDPPSLTADPRGGNEAAILSGGAELLRIRHDRPMDEARKLAGQLNDLLEAKGTRKSLCAECHRDRKAEVLEAACNRKWGIGPF